MAYTTPRSKTISVVIGCMGTIFAFAYACLIMKLVGGWDHMGIFAIIAISIPLMFSLKNDYAMLGTLRDTEDDTVRDAGKDSAALSMIRNSNDAYADMIGGQWVGMFIGAVFFLFK